MNSATPPISTRERNAQRLRLAARMREEVGRAGEHEGLCDRLEQDRDRDDPERAVGRDQTRQRAHGGIASAARAGRSRPRVAHQALRTTWAEMVPITAAVAVKPARRSPPPKRSTSGRTATAIVRVASVAKVRRMPTRTARSRLSSVSAEDSAM